MIGDNLLTDIKGARDRHTNNKEANGPDFSMPTWISVAVKTGLF